METDILNHVDAGAAREPFLSESEFRLFRDLIHEECGVSIGAEKKLFLESRLKRRMDGLGVKGGYEYYSLLKQGEYGQREMATLLDTLMICETSFFRNPPQFDLLRDSVLPEIVRRKERSGHKMLRVWSAGCSTGQEPYSVAMTALELLGGGKGWSFKVFASDLSFTALERAKCGLYRADQMKGLGGGHLKKYFKEEGNHFAAAETLKKHVLFEYENLKHDNGLRGLDIIFCRNVMIYFDADGQRRLVDRFATSLLPGGYLFLGHAESLQGLSGRFTMLHRNKGIAYRLNG